MAPKALSANPTFRQLLDPEQLRWTLSGKWSRAKYRIRKMLARPDLADRLYAIKVAYDCGRYEERIQQDARRFDLCDEHGNVVRR